MTRKKLIIFILFCPTLLLAAGMLAAGPCDLAQGLLRIITSPSILLTDYLAVGGLGATLVNAGACGLISCLLVIFFKIDINGPFIAAIFTVIGFSFFGKNIANIWPIFLGVALYARAQKAPFKNYLLVALFGTTLAPLASHIAFGSWTVLWLRIITGITFGVLAGFVLPPLASHMLRFHDGYNIYNIGFTGGMIGSFIAAVLRSFGFDINATAILCDRHDGFFRVILSCLFLGFMLLGLKAARKSPEGLVAPLKKIHASSGRLVSDFTTIGGYPAAIFNMGVMGMASMLFVTLLNGSLNGPVIGGIFTVVGFAAFGKHLKNCLPIMIGVYLASLIKIWGTGTTEMIIAGLFGTTLAPIAGQYGPIAGIAAGFCHLSVVMNVGMLHGGMNLYNNGFAGGFVASALVPLIDAFKKDKRK
jgi:hypothetical protein